MLVQIKKTAEFLKEKTNFSPEIGIILGSGLGSFVDEVDIKFSIPYNEIPEFPLSTVEGHSGKLIFGYVKNKEVVVMQGRFHYYEEADIEKVVFPVRVMKYLGIKKLLISNASGGVNPDFEIGDLMIIDDHINLIPNPLVGPNQNELGTRFPDMSQPYCKNMISIPEEIAESTLEELAAIQGFDEDIAGELQNRAIEFVERESDRINAALDEMKVADDLRAFEYISLAMLLTLAENEIRTLDDLAGLDNEELVELLGQHGLSDDGEAGDIIMAARAHWFTDETADSTDTDDASASSDS